MANTQVTPLQKLFIKFVPFNENTISNLINKTIWFSSVYDFNDFNEESIFVRWGDTDLIENYTSLIKALELYLPSSKNKLAILNCIQSSAGLNMGYKKTIENNFDTKSITEIITEHHPTIIEVIAYLETGIYCISHTSVLEDDAAQLMFAHYGANLTGLALIYEAHDDSLLKKVRCDKSDDCDDYSYCDSRDEQAFLNLINGEEYKSFMYKSKRWKYENEYRIFGKRGLSPAANHKLCLKGIFYTHKAHSKIETLRNINHYIYDDKIFIKELFKNWDPEKHFRVEHDGRACNPLDFLKSLT